jgi:ribosomal-protein-alanine N-acetyltransferase
MAVALDQAIGVRHAGPGDAAFIEELATQAFADFTPNAGPTTSRLVAATGAETMLAVRSGERLGFVVVEHGENTSHVQAIAVLRAERGRGVGTRLMAAAEQTARRAGARRLSLTTAQANLEALELFLKRGFRIEKRMARFYRNGQDACVLSRSL